LSGIEINNTPKKLKYRLFFVGNDEDDVEILEVNELDLSKMKKRLECGKDIFISEIN
jgi:hypothetical protein